MLFTIDRTHRRQIDNLIKYANKNIITLSVLKKIRQKKLPPPGDLSEYRIFLPVNFKVVYTIEEHLNKRIFKHISISVNDRLPSPIIAEEIIKEFKFENNLDKCYIWDEEYFQGCRAINILEPFSNGNNK